MAQRKILFCLFTFAIVVSARRNTRKDDLEKKITEDILRKLSDEDYDIEEEMEIERLDDVTVKRGWAPRIRLNTRKCPTKTWVTHSCTVSHNGCGSKKLTDFVDVPFSGALEPTCNKHDMCYNCAQRYGWTQRECDDAFLKDMKDRCNCYYSTTVQSVSKATCLAAAEGYYKVVREMGHNYILSISQQLCSDTCTIERGSPQISYM